MVNNQPLPLKEGKQPRFFYGYFIVLASFLILMMQGGIMFSFGVFFKPLLNEFGWTRAATSGAFALYMILSGFLGIFTGRLNDRFGPRIVVTVGGILVGLGLLLTSTVSTVWQIYLYYGVLLGIGTAGFAVPLLSTVARWFIKGRGLASGIVFAGASVGIIIFPPLASQLILSYSWRVSYVIIGLIALVLVVSAAQFLRRDPGKKGLLAYGADEAQTSNPNLQIHGFSFREAIRRGQFWIIVVAYLIFGFCVQTIMVHIVPHATDIGVPVAVAATVLSAIGLLSIGGNVGMGNIGDRIGYRQAMIVVFILFLVCLLWLNFASELWTLYLFAVVFGIAYGGSAAVVSPLVAEYFGLKAHGVILGLVIFALTMGSAIGPLVAGGIFDISGSYYWAFVICIILSIAGLILSILLKSSRNLSDI